MPKAAKEKTLESAQVGDIIRSTATGFSWLVIDRYECQGTIAGEPAPPIFNLRIQGLGCPVDKRQATVPVTSTTYKITKRAGKAAPV